MAMLLEYRFRVRGLSPLLVHNPAGSMGVKGPTGRSQVPPPEEEAERSTYRDQDGNLVFPVIAFRNALVGKGGVASSYKIKGRKTAKAFFSHMRVAEEYCLLRDPDTGEALREYAIDKRRAVVQGQGIIRARARFDRWGCEIGFLVLSEVAQIVEAGEDRTGRFLAAMLNDAGQTVGVGDYRPAKTGWFGMFEVEVVV